MESPNTEMTGANKRKRTPIDDKGSATTPGQAQSSSQIPLQTSAQLIARQPVAHGMGLGVGVGAAQNNLPQINYLVKASGEFERLRLIEGDPETFRDVLGMIDDYEGVLQRHESLAANLGAKLVSPLLLKSFEKIFDGPIKVLQSSFAMEQLPVSWLDIVTFARTNPSEFFLTGSGDGTKVCQFWIGGGQIEISEDDYRLIMSGAPERMIPTRSIPEDEKVELATLNILESRLAMLIKKADAVASKARQLNYHLKGRKAAVMVRKAADQPPGVANEETRTFSAQPFSPINSRSPAPVNGESAKFQQDLLEYYLSSCPPSSAPPRPRAARLSTSESPATYHTLSNAHQGAGGRRMSHGISEDGNDVQYRMLMAAKIEKLTRGDRIYPPCDRCRRLRFDCTKHLTACSACTKKHAKCSWKDIKEGELDGASSGRVHSHTQESGYATSASSEQETSDSSVGRVEGNGEEGLSMQATAEDVRHKKDGLAEQAVLMERGIS